MTISLDRRCSTKCWELDSIPVSRTLDPRPQNARYSGLCFFVFGHEVLPDSFLILVVVVVVEPDPWSPLLKNVREDLKETFLKEVRQFLDRGKFQDYAENAAFNALLPVSRRGLRRTDLLRASKMDSPYQT